jgi:hypothetical protein
MTCVDCPADTPQLNAVTGVCEPSPTCPAENPVRDEVTGKCGPWSAPAYTDADCDHLCIADYDESTADGAWLVRSGPFGPLNDEAAAAAEVLRLRGSGVDPSRIVPCDSSGSPHAAVRMAYVDGGRIGANSAPVMCTPDFARKGTDTTFQANSPWCGIYPASADPDKLAGAVPRAHRRAGGLRNHPPRCWVMSGVTTLEDFVRSYFQPAYRDTCVDAGRNPCNVMPWPANLQNAADRPQFSLATWDVSSVTSMEEAFYPGGKEYTNWDQVPCSFPHAA